MKTINENGTAEVPESKLMLVPFEGVVEISKTTTYRKVISVEAANTELAYAVAAEVAMSTTIEEAESDWDLHDDTDISWSVDIT